MKSGIKDGINLRERKVKRGYLRQEEMNQIMMLGATHQLLMGIRSLTGVGDCVPIWEKFEQSGIITKEQIKYLNFVPPVEDLGKIESGEVACNCEYAY